MRFDLDLDLLRFFVALAQSGSVAEAARLMGASRGTVRRKLGELEETTGTPLLLRRGAALEPTEAGEIVLERGREMIRDAEAVVDVARSLGQEPTGVVRIATCPGLPPVTYALFMRLIGSRFPKLAFEFVDAVTMEEALMAEADIALILERQIPSGPWDVLDLPPARERLMASRAYLDAHGTPERPEDLRDHTLLVWRSPEDDPTQLPLLEGGATLAVRPAFVMADIHKVRQMALFGVGIAYVPDAHFSLPSEPDDAMTPVLDSVIGRSRPIRVLVPSAVRDTPKVRAVVEAIAGTASSLRTGARPG